MSVNASRSLARYLLCACALLSGCGRGRDAVDGRVIDAEHDGAPVSGAFVLITRLRGFAMTSDTACGAQELVMSDEEGRFHVDPWSAPGDWLNPLPADYWIELAAYKHGFLGASRVRVSASSHGVIALQSLNLTPKSQLDAIRGVSFAIECSAYGPFPDTTQPLRAVLNADAAELAKTPEELDRAVGLLSAPVSVAPQIRKVTLPSPNSSRGTAVPTAPDTESH